MRVVQKCDSDSSRGERRVGLGKRDIIRQCEYRESEGSIERRVCYVKCTKLS